MLKSANVVRKMDALGRLVIPLELRKRLGWTEETPLEFFIGDDKSIMMREYRRGCDFCGNADGVVQVEGLLVCRNCAAKLAKRLKEVV